MKRGYRETTPYENTSFFLMGKVKSKPKFDQIVKCDLKEIGLK